MYSPDRMYGFVESGRERVFFHLEAFMVGSWTPAPPPIVGEEVRVDYAPNEGSEKAPRARLVARIHEPVFVTGVVETFNPDKGWGFAKGEDGESYYLHRSEVEGGRLPLPGQQVRFFRGAKKGRPRACYVRVGRVLG